MLVDKHPPARPGRELQGYGADRPTIEWPNGARVALSVVLNFEEGSERTPLYGDAVAEPVGEGFSVPPGLRDVRHESALEYGTRVGVWRILQLLETYEVRATVFAAALALELHAAAGKALADAGHEIASHGYRWLPFNTTVSEEEERRWVDKVVEISLATTGQRPVGWFSRGPRESTREMLIDEGGFLYDCDSFADDLPYFVNSSKGKWLVLPYNTVCNDMNFWRPPGYSNPDDYFVRAKAALDRASLLAGIDFTASRRG